MNALVNPWAFFIIIRLAQFVFKIIKLMEVIKKIVLFVNVFIKYNIFPVCSKKKHVFQFIAFKNIDIGHYKLLIV